MIRSIFSFASRCIYRRARDANLVCPIVFLQYVLRRRKTDILRSHSDDVTVIVPGISNDLRIAGNVNLCFL